MSSCTFFQSDSHTSNRNGFYCENGDGILLGDKCTRLPGSEDPTKRLGNEKLRTSFASLTLGTVTHPCYRQHRHYSARVLLLNQFSFSTTLPAISRARTKLMAMGSSGTACKGSQQQAAHSRPAVRDEASFCW